MAYMSRHSLALGLLCSTALIPAGAGWAEEQLPYHLGQVVLFGLNRTVTVEDSTTSVHVFDSEIIERDGGNASVQEAVREVPNVYFPSTSGAPVFRGQPSQGSNRGASAFFAGTTPRATISVDGARLGFNQLTYGSSALWDVDSVEVYRGPQTTSQGANSIAGAIVVNSKDPTFSPEGAVRLGYGSFERQQVSAMFSQALGDDVAVRLSFDHSARDSYTDYTNPAFDPGLAPIGQENTTGRIKLLWAPQANPGLEVKLTYSYTDTEGQQGEQVQTPFDARESTITNPAGWVNKAHSGALDISYDFAADMTLTNRLVYTDTTTRRYVNPLNYGYAMIDSSEWSNDLRLTFGDESGRLSGVAGIYLSRIDADESVDLSGAGGGISRFDDIKESTGVYAELTYNLDDHWQVTGGLRYQSDQIHREGNVNFRGTASIDFDETFDAVLPNLSITYNASEDLALGFAYSTGINPGGVSYSFTRSQYVSFKEERAKNYELFLRGAFLDGRLNMAGNLFYTDIEDAQRRVRTPLVPPLFEEITVNAESAHAYGLELSGDFRASEQLRIWGSAGILRTEFDTFTASLDDYSGKSFADAPEYTITLGAAYDVTERFTLSGTLTHVAGHYSDDLNTTAYETDDYTLADIQAEYRTDFGGTLYAYVNNIADETAATDISPGVRGGLPSAAVTPPREFGMGLRMDF